MQRNEKLRIIVRQDMEPGYQIAQSVHAARQFAEEHPEKERSWFRGSNTIVILGVRNQDEILGVIKKARTLAVSHSVFREPDLNNEITAVAIADTDKTQKVCKGLHLVL